MVRTLERLLAGVDSKVIKKLVLISHGEATTFRVFVVEAALEQAVLLFHVFVFLEAVVLVRVAHWSLKWWKLVELPELLTSVYLYVVIGVHL